MVNSVHQIAATHQMFGCNSFCFYFNISANQNKLNNI